jgi:hypothetical protein
MVPVEYYFAQTETPTVQIAEPQRNADSFSLLMIFSVNEEASETKIIDLNRRGRSAAVALTKAEKNELQRAEHAEQPMWKKVESWHEI